MDRAKALLDEIGRNLDRGPVFARFSPSESEAAEKIVDRAMGIYTRERIKADRMALHMNLSACHATCPLDLPKLAAADDFNLMHDVGGIARHLNRDTGLLGGHFVPRCARKASLCNSSDACVLDDGHAGPCSRKRP